MTNHRKFIEMLRQRFPAIAAAVDDSGGLLHVETGTFARQTDAALRSGDIQTVRDHFAFVNEVLANAHPDVTNAIYVSYLESIFIGVDDEFATRARELLPGPMRVALKELEDHWENIERSQRESLPPQA